MRIKGERWFKKRYTVLAVGVSGTRAVVLHRELPVEIGDIVVQSVLPDGTMRIARTGEKKPKKNAGQKGADRVEY